MNPVERIKKESDGLRGTLPESLKDELTGALYEDDQSLIKFHGMYQQDDRDKRASRAEKKLERLYSFMIRLRLPGGFLTPAQWLATHDIAGSNATGIIKITTRQTLQLHGILKAKVKPTLQAFDKAILDSIAACGDVNRNVTAAAHPKQSPVHEEIHAFAAAISDYLKPKTRAYYEVFLDEEKIGERVEDDPLYQDRYLPRKFKVAIAIPPNNDVDVFTNDLGLIAIVKDGRLEGFNIAIGGGLGATHGNAATFPRLANVIGFVSGKEEVLRAVYEVVTIQRDWGNREDRKLSRLKYTVEKYGAEVIKKELEQRLGFKLEPAREFAFTERKDDYGWAQNHEGLWYYTLFTENGRVLDEPHVQTKTALWEVAGKGLANFRFTCNQNVILSDILPANKKKVAAILKKYHVHEVTEQASVIRKNAMACVALNTCPLALAEAQRYLPSLIDKIEPLLLKYDLGREEIILRMTGCPNGCARPYAAEIGFVGTALGKYNLHLGADRVGQRLNKLYKENLDETQILEELDRLFEQYATQQHKGETFGDFTVRKQWVIHHNEQV